MGTGLIERWASFRRLRYLRQGRPHPAVAPVSTVVIVSAALYVLLNLAGDVLAFLVNPRLRGPA